MHGEHGHLLDEGGYEPSAFTRAGQRRRVTDRRYANGRQLPVPIEFSSDEVRFDETDTELEIKSCSDVVSLKTFAATIPNQLLLSSLLEHLCSVYEKNPQQSKCLFKLLCQKLADMKLITPLAFRDEFSTVRLQHTSAFAELLQAARKSLHAKELPFDPGECWHRTDRSSDCLLPSQISRYLSEFEEVKRLGKGGYGEVYKVRNNLDGQFYAVKRILIKKASTDCMKILREAKVLSGLHHPNIVGYHTAWLEHVQCISQTGNATKSSNLPALKMPFDCKDERGFSSHQNVESSSSYIVFADSASAVGNTSVASKHSVPPPSDTKNGFVQREIEPGTVGQQSEELKSIEMHLQVASVDSCKAVCTVDFPCISFKNNETKLEASKCSLESGFSVDAGSQLQKERRSQVQPEVQFHLMLYIQMQFCELSLSDWILERNAHLEDGGDPYCLVDEESTLKMFKQLLEGVHYIHSMGILHRDLKPRNIFLYGPDLHVRIGDFGLACRDVIVEDETTWLTASRSIGSSHTSGVGTCLYASPEQLHGSHYDFMCDMYSVGIILLELFQPFGTEMERTVTLTALRRGKAPDAFQQRWPVHSKYVKLLTSKLSAERPSALSVLQSELFCGEGKVIQDLQKKMEEQEEEIQKLKEKIHLLMSGKDL